MTELEPVVQVALKSVHGGYIHATPSGQLVRKMGGISRSAIFKVEGYQGSNENFSFFSIQNRCCITAEEEGEVVCRKKYRDQWDQWNATIVKKKLIG
jgi:hypothetical protein